MSKLVKDLMTREIARRLEGVSDALLVDVVGMNANANTLLRQQLRENNIQLMVIKNSLAQRATEGTPLGAAFHDAEGSLALVWGGEDIVSLAKIITRYADDDHFAPLAPRGGVLDGSPLDQDGVRQVSKWPSRTEQLSLLVGQILSVGATLSAQLLGPGKLLASQIEQVGEGGESGDEPESAAPETSTPEA